MVGGVIAHPFAKLLWIGLMPDVDPYTIEHMHCVMPTPTARPVTCHCYYLHSLATLNKLLRSTQPSTPIRMENE